MKPVHAKLIDETQSVCPVCLQVVDAQIIHEDGRVYMKKICPDHGPVTSYLWTDVEHYLWMTSFRLPFTQPQIRLPSEKGCPRDCGLCNLHMRHSTLVEIEVTHRCNLRCPVCFMAAGTTREDPSIDELEKMFYAIYEQCGPQVSIQLTGGEPTIRPDLPRIIQLAHRIGFEAVEINTNGVVISEKPGYLESLAEAGISGIYLQFDGLTAEPYHTLRGKDILANKLSTIEICRQAGVQVVLAATLIQGVNHDQIGKMLDFALQNVDVVAGLALQPAFTSGRFEIKQNVGYGMGDVIMQLSEQSKGIIQPKDMWPLGCSHPLCSCGTHLIKEGDVFVPVTRVITPEEYKRKFNTQSPQGSVFADIMANMHVDGRDGLSVIIMNYMDAMTIDLKRLKECSMTVTMKDGRLIPFCAYQLTDLYGHRLHPAWGEPMINEVAHAGR